MEDQRSTPPTGISNNKLAQTQANVDELVGLIHDNINKVAERGVQLSELDNRAEILQREAGHFEQQAGKLKRKYWWQNLKVMLIIGAIVAVVIIIIILIVWATSGGSSSAPAPASPAITDKPLGTW